MNQGKENGHSSNQQRQLASPYSKTQKEAEIAIKTTSCIDKVDPLWTYRAHVRSHL